MPCLFVVTHVLEDIITLACCPCLGVCYDVPSSVLMTPATVVMVGVCLSITLLTIHGLFVWVHVMR